MKCDEGYPVCHRCVSTGRICDGYGIWGGGGNFYGHRHHAEASKQTAVVPVPGPISVLVVNPEEKESFEWFRAKTAVKLPGSFISEFWGTILPRASLGEPAVLHAVLALSSIHKGGMLKKGSQILTHQRPDGLEQVTLQHYLKAIRHLQPHLLAGDKSSFRVAILTCIVFVSLDFLRGHFNTAQIHLQSGLKLLKEVRVVEEGEDGLLLLKTCPDPEDRLVAEVFARLHLQVELFKVHPRTILQATELRPLPSKFLSYKEAWGGLERLLNTVLHIDRQARNLEAIGMPPHEDLGLIERQLRTREELSRWLKTCEASRNVFLSTYKTDKGFYLLTAFQTMTAIMADTCLYPGNEEVYDAYTDQFLKLLGYLSDLWDIGSSTYPPLAMPGIAFTMHGTIIDLAWAPPLYYVAVKCRVHRVRRHAISLLETTFHREGIWDTRITTLVTRQIVKIEERGFYNNTDMVQESPSANDFPHLRYPNKQDLSLPRLPSAFRLRDVQVILVGAPLDKVLLFCTRRVNGKDRKVRISEYDVHSHRWISI